ncbi:rhodanese-like domain-containing protein [Natrarchaeobius oligotrophus]|uniref:Rhodanese-like domain-containing protein n=1 Tax=Natrarchaeobius chitinivorans TaxID=1679083 RepID=A0A3N6N0I9_NATCH|nr:rhodanese-like domain-containing protein [Natrarchaeobius chitinivorans]RQH00967.1 rhodanese-like domain-containing protein [Natrarchaeobius chitinivorans]
MNRRQYLIAGMAATVTAVAGCLGGNNSTDGYGPEPEEVPEERSIDTDEYETKSFGGIDVPLAPLEDVHYWYQRQEARMVDTRGRDQYDAVRITGAVLSSAPDGVSNDPVATWPEEDRVVTYCVCPHTLAGQRAATLIADGYENVYALDEGLQAWFESGYRIEGSEATQSLTAYTVRGRSDPAYAGEFVTVRTLESDQSEMSAVESDGSYELTLHFTDVDDDTVLEVDAPSYTREMTLAEATSDVISA